jgi:hypothetical protein
MQLGGPGFERGVGALSAVMLADTRFLLPFFLTLPFCLS